MKKTILALAVIATLASCKKSKDQIPESVKPSTDIEVAITNGDLLNDPAQQGNPTYNLLGFGYDVTDQYNDAHSVRAEVVNIPAFVATSPGRFDLSRATSGFWTNFSGQNATDLAGQLSRDFDETKGLKVFKNTMKQAFPDANTFDGKYVYGYYANIAVRMRLRITDDYKNSLSSNLTNGFTQDVNTLNATELVKKYGTHVLRSIRLGSRLNVVYQAEAGKGDREKISTTGLRYAMKKIFGLSTGELDPMDLNALNANSKAKIYFDAVGGDQSKLKVTKINEKSMINITDWLHSSTEEKARFVDVSPDGLIPLYELITDANKKAEVKAYIEKYILDNQAK